MGILELNKVSWSPDGTSILNDVNLDLWEGYVHAIVGPNGAGKSTLAFSVMGLDGYRNIQGDMKFDGQVLNGMSVDQRARMGITLAWQEPARFEGLPVRKFIETSLKGDKSKERVDDILSRVGLDPGRYASRAVDKSLSGGERKKVELASILALRPKLVMLDEPDSGIDVESLHRIQDAIRILKDDCATVLLITHSMEVLSWAEHAFLMCCGHIVDKGDIDKITYYFNNKCIPCDHKNQPQMDGVT